MDFQLASSLHEFPPFSKEGEGGLILPFLKWKLEGIHFSCPIPLCPPLKKGGMLCPLADLLLTCLQFKGQPNDFDHIQNIDGPVTVAVAH